jgi:3-mercaptopyruvate sulfurtransferase SseA
MRARDRFEAKETAKVKRARAIFLYIHTLWIDSLIDLGQERPGVALGHVPGAYNIPWGELISPETGFFKYLD